ncbi:MAG: glycosyltransferase [Candidatus Bathyarchaeia archaeon]
MVTYNRCSDLQECLTSLFNLKDELHEVIVVDSNSTDGTKKLSDRFPIRYISIRERNRQHARNVGVSEAGGDVVAFLDDDVVVHNEWLRHICGPYLDNSVGGVGGRVIPYGKPNKFYVEIGRSEVGKVLDSGFVIGNFDIPFDNLREVDSFIGCNMSFRRDLLLEVGGFDENYMGTSYRDDTDICMCIKRLGYKLIYNSKALVWHKFKGKQVGTEWLYWYIRNQTYFYFKNFFAQSKTTFPQFLRYTFFPPRDYVLKSNVRVKVEPLSVVNALKGLRDGYKAWRRFVTTKSTLKTCRGRE